MKTVITNGKLILEDRALQGQYQILQAPGLPESVFRL